MAKRSRRLVFYKIVPGCLRYLPVSAPNFKARKALLKRLGFRALRVDRRAA
jgi:hypothetical protein